MSEHQMKEQLPQKSSHKPQQAAQAMPTTAEGANDDLIRLQRLVGNHAVNRMLIQAKMTVGAADDPYEREADAVASQVMAKRNTVQRSEAAEEEGEELQMKRIQRESEGGEGEEEELQMKRINISSIQRSEAAEEEGEELQMKRIQRESEGGEGEEEELQMKRADSIQRESEGGEGEEEELQMKRIQAKKVDMSGSFDVEKDVESQISAKSGSGQTIPDVNREMFESSMGHDFSGVNIHADSESDGLNKQLGARAFTTGSDIFFRQGEYNPGSSGGQELLAHELTHVVQQGGAQVQKKEEDK